MKNTFLQSPIIALQYLKNSAWAIEKLYRKMCKKRLFKRNLHYICEGYASTIFTRVYMKFKAQKSNLVHGFTPRDYTPGKIKNFNYLSAEKNSRIVQINIIFNWYFCNYLIFICNNYNYFL